MIPNPVAVVFPPKKRAAVSTLRRDAFVWSESGAYPRKTPGSADWPYGGSHRGTADYHRPLSSPPHLRCSRGLPRRLRFPHTRRRAGGPRLPSPVNRARSPENRSVHCPCGNGPHNDIRNWRVILQATTLNCPALCYKHANKRLSIIILPVTTDYLDRSDETTPPKQRYSAAHVACRTFTTSTHHLEKLLLGNVAGRIEINRPKYVGDSSPLCCFLPLTAIAISAAAAATTAAATATATTNAFTTARSEGTSAQETSVCYLDCSGHVRRVQSLTHAAGCLEACRCRFCRCSCRGCCRSRDGAPECGRRVAHRAQKPRNPERFVAHTRTAPGMLSRRRRGRYAYMHRRWPFACSSWWGPMGGIRRRNNQGFATSNGWCNTAWVRLACREDSSCVGALWDVRGCSPQPSSRARVHAPTFWRLARCPPDRSRQGTCGRRLCNHRGSPPSAWVGLLRTCDLSRCQSWRLNRSVGREPRFRGPPRVALL